MNTRRTALTTGTTGHDGDRVAKFLLNRNCLAYESFTRRTADTLCQLRLLGIDTPARLIDGDPTDLTSILRAVEKAQPDEVYNLGARNFVATSPLLRGHFTALGVATLREAVRITKPATRFFQASSSEMVGKVQHPVQDEATPFYSRTSTIDQAMGM